MTLKNVLQDHLSNSRVFKLWHYVIWQQIFNFGKEIFHAARSLVEEKMPENALKKLDTESKERKWERLLSALFLFSSGENEKSLTPKFDRISTLLKSKVQTFL